MADTYYTISQIGEGSYSEKRSRFIAYAHPVASIAQIRELIAAYRKKYYDARHICYAYMLGYERTDFRANDDGEPANTAGKPILGQINSHELTDILVVVVRYYGGVNLGTGGLMVAYRTAASVAIENARIVSKTIKATLTFSFPYILMDKVMRIVKEMNAEIVETHYDNTCEIKLSIVLSKVDELKERLNKAAFD
ncbi:YigZ family protein [Hoylesella saccharolytica]|uniref:IMPACT family protein n=1 Tax=Hoylesella saccharolytica TaxID=633701 RepID=UPI0028F000A1|nr:YigZ family protein [Hoylesella saccharolytica]